MIGSNLLRYNNDQIYVLLDTETEGLHLYYSRPWQVSWVVFKLLGFGKYEILSSHDRFVRYPDLRVSTDAARVTRFDINEYNQRAEDPGVVCADLFKDLGNPDYRIVGHNILHFDSAIIQILRRTANLPTDYFFLPRVIDTLALARAYRMGFKFNLSTPQFFLNDQYRLLSIDGRTKKFKASLGALAKEFGVPYDETAAHRADYDIMLNIKVLAELVGRVEV